MSEHEFWKDLGGIFDAILSYQKKNVEFNKQFINPWLRLGNIFDRADQHKEAVEAFSHAAEIDPESAQNWLSLGDAQFKNGEFEQAGTSYSRAIELDPSSGWSRSNLALTHVMQANYNDAIPLYLESIELLSNDQDKAICWNRLGNVYRKVDDYQNAFIAFQNADKLDSNNTGFNDVLDDTSTEGSESLANDILEQMVIDKSIETQIESVAGEAEDNVLASETSVQIQPTFEDPEIQNAIGYGPNVAMIVEENIEDDISANSAELESVAITTDKHPWMIEDEETAQESAHEEITMEEDPPVLHLQDSSELEKAESTLELTQEVFTESPIEESAGELSGSVNTLIDDLVGDEDQIPVFDSQITDDIQNEIQMEGQNPETDEFCHPDEEQELEETAPVELLSSNVTEETLAEADTPVEGDHIENLSHEAAYQEYLMDVSEPTAYTEPDEVTSEQPLTEITPDGDVRIPMDTKNAHVWNELGNVYLNSGDFDDAVASYGKAIELDREFAWPYSNLALAYVQKGSFAEAILLYQRGLELFTSDKDKAITWNRLGNVYRRLGDYPNAIAAYQTADELDPENATLSLRSNYGILGNVFAEHKQD